MSDTDQEVLFIQANGLFTPCFCFKYWLKQSFVIVDEIYVNSTCHILGIFLIWTGRHLNKPDFSIYRIFHFFQSEKSNLQLKKKMQLEEKKWMRICGLRHFNFNKLYLNIYIRKGKKPKGTIAHHITCISLEHLKKAPHCWRFVYSLRIQSRRVRVGGKCSVSCSILVRDSTVVHAAADTLHRSRPKLIPAQLFDRCRPRHTAAADHVFLWSTQTTQHIELHNSILC